jgi:hypothetical protein
MKYISQDEMGFLDPLQCEITETQLISALKIEAACSSETLVTTYKTARCHNPEEHNLKFDRSENGKSHHK